MPIILFLRCDIIVGDKHKEFQPVKNGHNHNKSTTSQKKQSFVKKLLLGLLILAILVGVWYFFVKQVNPAATEKTVADRNTVMSDAKRLAYSGKIDEAATLYDDAVSATSDSYEKSMLLISKATIYFNESKYDEALSITLEAEGIKPTETGTHLTAQIYEKLGDNQKAAEYYRKAIPLVDKTKPLADDDIAYYEYMAQWLTGEQK